MKSTLISFVFLLSLAVSAQTYNMPEEIKLKTKKQCQEAEPEFLKAYEFLYNNPPYDIEKRFEANAYVYTWTINVPYFSIVTDSHIQTFMGIGGEVNAQLFSIFLGGWAKYCIETKDYSNDLMCNYMGLESVILYCKKYPQTYTHESIKTLIEKYDTNVLKDWIKEELAAQKKSE